MTVLPYKRLKRLRIVVALLAAACCLTFNQAQTALASEDPDAFGFKVRDCEFRLLLEKGSFWIEFSRVEEQPRVYYSRYLPERRLVEIGVNCPIKIKEKTIRAKHPNFSLLHLDSDGVTFRISMEVLGLSSVEPSVVDVDPQDNILQILLLPPSVDGKPPIDSAVSESQSDVASANSSSTTSSSGVRDPFGGDTQTTEEFLSGVGKVLLPQPDMLDDLTKRHLGEMDETEGSDEEPIPAENETVSQVADQDEEIDSELRRVVRERQRAAQEREQYQGFEGDAKLISLAFGVLLVCSAVLVIWYRAKYASRIRAREQLYAQQGSPTQDLNSCYSLLGVRSTDSNERIKKRYKHLAKVFHADKLSTQELPDEMISLANERFQQIKDAYELIRKARKF